MNPGSELELPRSQSSITNILYELKKQINEPHLRNVESFQNGGSRCMTVDATICERQDQGGQAEVPSRDGAGPSTVRHAFRHG